MNSTPNPNPTSAFFLGTIVKYLPLAEKLLLTALVIGIILTAIHVDTFMT